MPKEKQSFKKTAAAYAAVKAAYDAAYDAAYTATPSFTTGGKEYWSYAPAPAARQRAYWSAAEAAESAFAFGLKGCGPLSGPTIEEALVTKVTKRWYAGVRKALVKSHRAARTANEQSWDQESWDDLEVYTPDPRRMALTKRRTKRLKNSAAIRLAAKSHWQSYQARKANRKDHDEFVEEANAQA